MPIIAAGTNLELNSRELFFSAVAKNENELGQLFCDHTNFVCTTAEECSSFLRYLLNKAKLSVTETELSIAGSWLQGLESVKYDIEQEDYVGLQNLCQIE